MMNVKMNEVNEKLWLVKEKHLRFKQQQFTFIAALDHCREHAHHRIQTVSTVSEVRRYMTHYCSNATDGRILLLFLDIMDNLKALFQMIRSLAASLNHSSEVLATCRKIFSPDCDFSHFQAHYPHEEVRRLSCTEARNYYGGVVSVIPITLDLISLAVSELAQASAETDSQTDITASEQQTASGNTQNTSVNTTAKPQASRRSFKPAGKRADEWKPVWKPTGHRGK